MILNNYSRIISGAMTYGKLGRQFTKVEMTDFINYCIEIGITSFDHADIYGEYSTESDFGNAFSESSIDREKILLISKCGIQYLCENRPYNKVKHYNYSKDYIISSVEGTLKNLKTEYLDLFLLHRPSPLMHAEIVADAISTLKQQGKIKAFGVSNFSPSQTDLINQHTSISVNQIEFSVTQHTAMHNDILNHMQINKIKPMAWAPLGSVFKEDNEQTKRIRKQLGKLKEKYNATEAQLLLAWILKHPATIYPVVGTTNKTRITNAVKAIDINLELQDWFSVLVASQGHKVP